MILAGRIARELRIEHTIIPPARAEKKDAIVVDHPLVRTYETLRTCEGMTSAYESIVGYLPYNARPTMSGQSGEILRAGGLLLLQSDLSDKALRRRVDATGGGWNWRTSPGEKLTGLLRDHILGHLDLLAPIVKPDEVRKLFAEPVLKKPNQAWHLYTVVTMLSGVYPGKEPDGLDPIHIPIPS